MRRIRVLLLAVAVSSQPAEAAALQGASYEQLQTFSGVLNQIRLNYVDSVTYTQLVRAAIDGVLASLDPHSYFLSRADGERQMAYESGQLAGAGIIFDDVDGLVTVQAVLPRSPGARAGLTAGDRVLSLNDTSVFGLAARVVQQRMIGDKGQKARIVVARGSRLEPESLHVTLKFDVIEPHSVTLVRLADPTTGYVRLSGFHAKAGEEMADAVKRLRSAGARRLVLDLRGNPGGVVAGAVDVASLFLPKGTVVFRTEGRRRSAAAQFSTEKDGPFVDLPMLALIDQGSASAAEALAGSLQDHDRALLLGRRSFGKALMQQLLPIPPQGDVIWLTIGRVVTPSGRIIQRRYTGLATEQYYSFAGRSGAEQDTLAVFKTDAGRPVRGGGGITPDVPLPISAELPVWWGIAADSGFDEAVADSLAALLGKDAAARAKWMDAASEWQARLVSPFLERVRARLRIAALPDSALQGRLGRILAVRAAEVRWGPDAAEEFVVRNDPDVRTALSYFPRLPEFLKAP